MSDHIEPALTAKQASEGAIRDGDTAGSRAVLWIEGDQLYADNSGGEYGPEVAPARTVAAVCLYGQRFGFSQEDLSALHVVAALDQALGLPLGDPARSQLASLASRIAALLPPVSDQTND